MRHPVGSRLLSAANFVRQGAYLADIGTDHAYLPLFLLGEGRIERAVCSDINRGPLESAERNAAELGLSEKIIFRLADGAAALADMGITDYAICGMGGELIAEIIDAAPHLSEPGVRLILQPMTKQAHLRKYLLRRGFSVVGESYSCESGKYYLCIAAEYSGEVRNISEFEAEFGNYDPRVELSAEQKGYIDAKIKALEKAMRGKRLGGESDSPEERLLVEFYERTAK